jgi:hypothetical protein
VNQANSKTGKKAWVTCEICGEYVSTDLEVHLANVVEGSGYRPTACKACKKVLSTQAKLGGRDSQVDAGLIIG